MAQRFCTRRIDLIAFALALALLVGGTSRGASAASQEGQQSSQQQQSSETQQPSPTQLKRVQDESELSLVEVARATRVREKAAKIWTNEDVISLRTPADIYLLEKEAQEAAAAEAAAKEAAAKEANQEAAAKSAEGGIGLPATLEETQKLIKGKEDQITDEQSGLERMTKELPDTPEDQKAALQKEIDRVTADLPKVQNELKQLQGHLEKLNKAQLEQAAPPSAAPPNQ